MTALPKPTPWCEAQPFSLLCVPFGDHYRSVGTRGEALAAALACEWRLTETERCILALGLAGVPRRELACALERAEGTVRKHITTLLRKANRHEDDGYTHRAMCAGVLVGPAVLVSSAPCAKVGAPSAGSGRMVFKEGAASSSAFASLATVAHGLGMRQRVCAGR